MSAPAKLHVLRRDTWLCDDGELWPCEQRHQQLLARYADNLTELRRWMAECRDKYLADNPHVTATAADVRFLAWIPEDPS